jgi:ABC-type glycerol-3-phosphate transport system substrate-binding protein
MRKFARAAALAAAVLVLTGCGSSSPTTPATDAESIKKLEELQKNAAQGEGGAKGKK